MGEAPRPFTGLPLLAAGLCSGAGLLLLAHQALGAQVWSLTYGRMPGNWSEIGTSMLLLITAQIILILADTAQAR